MVRLVRCMCVLGLVQGHHRVGRAQSRDDLEISLFEVDGFSEAPETVLVSGNISRRVCRCCGTQSKVMPVVERRLRAQARQLRSMVRPSSSNLK